MKKLLDRKYGILLLAVGASQLGVNATSVTIDQILADYPAGLSVVADMAYKGNTLTIILQNTSITSEVGANALLTGIGFNLPGTLSIASGVVTRPSGSVFVNFSGSQTDISGEWGYANGAQGHFNGLPVNSLVSTMEADTDNRFSSTALSDPSGLNGPEFGVLAKTGDAGGLEAIKDTIKIELTLAGSFNGKDLVSNINNGTIAVTFGSPTGNVNVPDGGTSAMLLGFGFLGMTLLAKTLKK